MGQDPTAGHHESAVIAVAPTLPEAIRVELRRLLVRPWNELTCVVANGVIMTVLWFFAPISIVHLVFSFHGTFVFPVVLASWMLADVPATNELAPDRFRAMAALDDPLVVRRLLRAKHLSLWLVVTPITVTASVIAGFGQHDPLSTLLAVLWLLTVPFSALGISCAVGVLWPYHPISMRQRWRWRRDRRVRWHMTWRWVILVTTPYGLVPLFGLISFIPSRLIWFFLGNHHPDRSQLHGIILLGIAVSIPLAWVIWHLGTTRVARLAHERRAGLRAYLSNPSLG